MGKHGIARLGRVGQVAGQAGAEAGDHGGRQAFGQRVLGDDAPGVGPGRGVGHRRPAGDHVERAADDVAEDQREQACGRGGARQLPAFDQAEVLAQAVDLADRGAARQERGRECLQVGQLNGAGLLGGCLEQGRAAARKQDDNEVIGLCLLRQGQHTLAGDERGVRGHRMAGLDQGDVLRGAAVARL